MCRYIAFVVLVMTSFALPGAHAVQPEVAVINFDSHCAQSTNYPAWIATVEQDSGQFSDNPPFWQADAMLPVGQGRVSIVVNRTNINEDLALQIVYEDDPNSDLVVQLFDAKNQVLALDLFSNVLAVGRDARTDTFIVPLRSYPTATRITLRRIRGTVKVYGVALYPVVGVAEADTETLEALAKLLGDKVSPDSPLAKRLAQLVSEHAGRTNSTPIAIWTKPPATLPGTSSTQENASSTGNADWVVLPFPANSDWPGPRGFAAVLGNNDFLLRGQNVRTRQNYSLPIRISFEFVLEERLTHDGSMQIIFDPADTPDHLQGDRNVDAAIAFRNPGVSSGNDAIFVNELLGLGDHFQGRGRTLWGETPFQLVVGQTYHVTLVANATGMQWTINNQTYDLPGIKVPFDKFRITLATWQPTNRWHVRNVVIN